MQISHFYDHKLTLLNVFYEILQNYKKNDTRIMLNTFSRSLIILEPAIETWAQEMNGGPGKNWGAQRAEQFPHLGNYTLTPGCRPG